jgi:hypothetical protein
MSQRSWLDDVESVAGVEVIGAIPTDLLQRLMKGDGAGEPVDLAPVFPTVGAN